MGMPTLEPNPVTILITPLGTPASERVRTKLNVESGVSCAGLMIGLESQPPHIYPRIIPALHDLYGWKPDDHEIRFFRGHVAADEIHSARGFQMTERYCNTPELRAAAIEAVRVAAQKRWNHMTGIYSYAVHGKDEPTPEP